MNWLRRLADRRDPRSLSARFRKARSLHLQTLLDALPRPLTILDLGGEAVFWSSLSIDDAVDVVLLNPDPQLAETQRFTAIAGDARDLSRFSDQSFEVVVSNSVIDRARRNNGRSAGDG